MSDSGAVITLRELYDIMVEVRTDVTQIKGTLESTNQKVNDHESRLRALEKWVWGAAGIGAVGGAGLAQILGSILGTS